MLLGAGVFCLFLAGSTTQGWMGLSDWAWIWIFAGTGCGLIGLHYWLQHRARIFRDRVNREVERKIYYYLREER